MGKSGRSQNRRNHLEKALRKRRGEKEQRRKTPFLSFPPPRRIGIKLFIFIIIFRIAALCEKKM
jgi:hypothetical protein